MAATVVVHPLDLLKNRMQLSGEGGGARAHRTVGHAAMSVFKTEGASGLYKGYIYLIQLYKQLQRLNVLLFNVPASKFVT